MPALLALAITMTVTVAVCIAFASLVVWAFGRVGVSLIADAARYQALYDSAIDWLEGHGIGRRAMERAFQRRLAPALGGDKITGRVNTTLSFWLIALLYVILGLMEVDDVRRRAKTFLRPETSRILLQGSAATVVKIRKYMEVRTLMSVATGVLVGAFAWIAGLPFALEWGVIAFALNYIPFIGPFVATLFPTLLAMAQFQSMGSRHRRFRLPEHHPVRGRQLYRAARVRALCSPCRPRSCCSQSSCGPFFGACPPPSSASRSPSRSSPSAAIIRPADGSPICWAARLEEKPLAQG